MLKMTKVELEKISDADIHLFIERGMRGGICCVLKRYSKANNEFCLNYDKTKLKVYINLYGKAMSEYLPCVDNKKVPGKMKDEYGGTPILEYARAKPKSYTANDVNNYEKSTHKGDCAKFRSSEFKDVLFNKKVFRHIMKKIGSKKHKIYTQESNKRSLSCFHDKRYILDDGINTLAYGHKDIPKNG